jgi:hypothetical protein
MKGQTKTPAFIGLSAILLLTVMLSSSLASQAIEIEFRVLLDDKEIGTHWVELRDRQGKKQVTIEANFDVKVFFLNVYKYRHRNTEIWNGGCIDQINARTDANGKEYFISSAYSEQGLLLSTHDGEKSISGCVRTFAYWDPALLNTERLLNSQTGEYISASLDEIGYEDIWLADEKVRAKRYRLSAGENVIDLWYSIDSQWLALESMTDSGQKLRYEATEGSRDVTSKS